MYYKLLYYLCLLSFLLSCNGKGTKNSKNINSYKLIKKWPVAKDLKIGNPTGIGIDSKENIFIFHRAGREWPLFGAMPKKFIEEPTIIKTDRNGVVLNTWGAKRFIMPHGLTIDNEDNVWVSDVGLHQVFKFSNEGKLLMCIGIAGVAANDSLHLNRPTDIAIAKDGSFYVSDGYGNSRVVKFSAEGKYILEWGKKGEADGEFNIPHSITLDEDGNVYVADRENKRIEVFNGNGIYIKEISSDRFGNICGIFYDKTTKQVIAVDDENSWFGLQHHGSNVIIINKDGSVFDKFGKEEFKALKLKGWFHDIVADRNGDIYVGDILENKVWKFQKIPMPAKK